MPSELLSLVRDTVASIVYDKVSAKIEQEIAEMTDESRSALVTIIGEFAAAQADRAKYHAQAVALINLPVLEYQEVNIAVTATCEAQRREHKMKQQLLSYFPSITEGLLTKERQ